MWSAAILAMAILLYAAGSCQSPFSSSTALHAPFDSHRLFQHAGIDRHLAQAYRLRQRSHWRWRERWPKSRTRSFRCRSCRARRATSTRAAYRRRHRRSEWRRDLNIVGNALPRSVLRFRLTRFLQHLFQLFERFGVLRADWGIVAAGIRSLQSTNHSARNREGSATMVAFAHEVPLRMGCTVTSKAVPAKSIDDIDGPSFAN